MKLCTSFVCVYSSCSFFRVFPMKFNCCTQGNWCKSLNRRILGNSASTVCQWTWWSEWRSYSEFNFYSNALSYSFFFCTTIFFPFWYCVLPLAILHSLKASTISILDKFLSSSCFIFLLTFWTKYYHYLHISWVRDLCSLFKFNAKFLKCCDLLSQNQF